MELEQELSDVIAPTQVNIAELATLLGDERGTGVAWARLQLDLPSLDPQISRLGRGLLSIRAEADADGPAVAVADTLRAATVWATLRLETDPVVRLMFAVGPEGGIAMRIEEFGWVTAMMSDGPLPVDEEAISSALGGVFEVLDGPMAGTGYAWAERKSGVMSAETGWVELEEVPDAVGAVTNRLIELAGSVA